MARILSEMITSFPVKQQQVRIAERSAELIAKETARREQSDEELETKAQANNA